MLLPVNLERRHSMIGRIVTHVVFVALAMVAVSGCAPPLPDLVAVPRPGTAPRSDPEAFCNKSGSRLTVIVKNQGAADAGLSSTIVQFGAVGSSPQLPTAPIPVGVSVSLMFDIPPACFQPDCSFRITVDSDAKVPEGNEGNNTTDGTCIG